MGAITQLFASLSEEAGDYGGKVSTVEYCRGYFFYSALVQFLIPWARLGKARPETDDIQLGKELWTWLEERVANI